MQSRPNMNARSCYFSGCFSSQEAFMKSYCYHSNQAAGFKLSKQMLIIHK